MEACNSNQFYRTCALLNQVLVQHNFISSLLAYDGSCFQRVLEIVCLSC